MNCVGKGNAIYFIGLMCSLGALLTYGAYLGSSLLAKFLQADFVNSMGPSSAKRYWSEGLSWSEYFHCWAWAFQQNARIGSVGLLALLTSPLAWALFCYHVYLIWAGMTTSETSKWADWRDDVLDGLVFQVSDVDQERTRNEQKDRIRPLVQWPIKSNQRLIRCNDGSPTAADAGNSLESRSLLKVQSLAEVHNLYDLGFWDNLKDMFPATEIH